MKSARSPSRSRLSAGEEKAVRRHADEGGWSTMGAGSAMEELEAKIVAGTATVAVMGLGYVGLPLAVALVHRGYRVLGIDIDEQKVRMLQHGQSHIRDVAAGEVRASLAAGRLTVASDAEVLAEADAVIICVPTPITPQKEPDTTHIAAAAAQIAAYGRKGQLIILRSTSYPGTTEEVVRPILEHRGWCVGVDIFLAFAPERIDPGNTRFSVRHVPVVVGGCDANSTRLAGLLLGRIAEQVVLVSSPAVAEMTKLLENVFRNINIALVNQVAQLCDRMGLDIWEVAEAAATKPYGFMPFSPGLVGGHCIPVDPYYLAWKAREYDFHMDFIELAARVNEEMPFFIVNKLIALLRKNNASSGPGRVLLLGVAFKRDVDDARYSAALKVMQLLRRQKIDMAYHDPYIPEITVNGAIYHSEPLTEEVLRSAGSVLILTDHTCIDYAAVVRHARLVFDVRNATRAVTIGREKIVRL